MLVSTTSFILEFAEREAGLLHNTTLYEEEAGLELEIPAALYTMFCPDLSSTCYSFFSFLPLFFPTQGNIKSLQTTCLVTHSLSILSQSRKTFADPDI